MKRVAIILIVMVSVAGCTSSTYYQRHAPIDQSTIELSQAAVAINDHMQTLSEVAQDTDAVRVEQTRPNPAYFGMGQLATVDWSGPIEPFVKRLATLTEYRLQVFGTPPAIPVLISINKKNTMVGDLLREASLQSNKQVKVVVFPTSKLIEMHYLVN